MASLKSSINLIDNVSRTLNRITSNTDKMTRSIENSQNQMDKRTNFVENIDLARRRLEIVSNQYDRQSKRVQELVAKYQDEEKAIRQLKKVYSSYTDKSSIQAFMAKAELEDKVKSFDKYRDTLDKAILKEIKLANAVNKASKAFEKQEQAKKNLGRGIENATRNQRQFNNELNSGSNAADKLGKKIRNFIGAYLGIRGVKKGFDSTVMAAAELNQQAAVMQAAFGNADIGKHYFNKLQIFAIDARKNMEELTDVTKNFMQVTRNTDKLMGLTKAANRFAMRTGSIGSAESIMQEAMRGEYSRLQRSLHLTDSQIEPLKRAVQIGSLDGIISAFDQALNTAGLTDDIVQAFENSPLQKFYKIFDNAKFNFAMAGEEALRRLDPTLERINEWLTSDNATMYFNILGAVIAWIVDGISNLGDIGGSTIGFIRDNAEGLIPVIFGVAGGLLTWQAIQFGVAAATGIHAGVLRLQQIRTMEATMAQKAFNLALALNPITMVVMAILGLIVAITAFGNSSKSVREIFSNAFGAIVNIAEKTTNKVIDSVNWMITQLNKVRDFFGMASIDKIQYRADFSNFKDKGQEFIENVTIDSLMAKYGLDSTAQAIENFAGQEDIWNSMQNDTLGSLDKTGKDMKRSVDKSEEDLKWMRDLAEQEAINRFTTATLAPQLSFEFGDIRETADVDGIIEHIEKILTEQINISAEGVHS